MNVSTHIVTTDIVKDIVATQSQKKISEGS